jgi:hypothetical protein
MPCSYLTEQRRDNSARATSLLLISVVANVTLGQQSKAVEMNGVPDLIKARKYNNGLESLYNI